MTFKGLMLSAVIATTAMFGATAGARASVAAPTSVYDFSGACADCTGIVSAQLTLTGYTPGTTLTDANFVSFTYDGSDLLSAYTVSPTDVYLYGDLSTLPGANNVTLIGETGSGREFFFTSASGDWCTGPICGGDTGATHTWSVSAAPEPSSWALMIVGVGVLGVTLRARQLHVIKT